MRLTRGALEIARPGGVALRLHWSLPVGLAVLGGLPFQPARWALGLGVLFAHVLGHAVAVTLAGAKPSALTLSGLGGTAEWRGGLSPLARAAIAASGVGVQLLALAVLAWQRVGLIDLRVLEVVIALNLLPISPFDGADAWRLSLLLGRRVRDGRAAEVPIDRADEAFDAGERSEEVSALVTSMLEQAKREEP